MVILLGCPSALHRPSDSGPVVSPLCKWLRCNDFFRAPHLSGFIAQAHNHGTEVCPVPGVRGRRCRHYAKIEGASHGRFSVLKYFPNSKRGRGFVG